MNETKTILGDKPVLVVADPGPALGFVGIVESIENEGLKGLVEHIDESACIVALVQGMHRTFFRVHKQIQSDNRVCIVVKSFSKPSLSIYIVPQD